jgi:hypothetical protein
MFSSLWNTQAEVRCSLQFTVFTVSLFWWVHSTWYVYDMYYVIGNETWHMIITKFRYPEQWALAHNWPRTQLTSQSSSAGGSALIWTLDFVGVRAEPKNGLTSNAGIAIGKGEVYIKNESGFETDLLRSATRSSSLISSPFTIHILSEGACLVLQV